MSDTRSGLPRGAGTATRLKTGFEVSLAALLAGVVALLATWLAERPGARFLLDLSPDRANTLSPAATAALERLKEDVVVDVFFTPGPAGRVLAEAQETVSYTHLTLPTILRV